MIHAGRKIVALTATALIAAVALTGCASSDKKDASPSASPTLNVPAPVGVDVQSKDGGTVEVAVNRVLIVAKLGDAKKKYKAEVADPSVATYVEGYSADGGKTFTPGIVPNKIGTTKVTLIDESGNKSTFTVKVVAAKA